MIRRCWWVVIAVGVVVLTATPALARGGFVFSFGVGVRPGVHHFHHPTFFHDPFGHHFGFHHPTFFFGFHHHPRFFHHPFGRPHGVFLDPPVHRPRMFLLQPHPPMGWWRR